MGEDVRTWRDPEEAESTDESSDSDDEFFLPLDNKVVASKRETRR